jgi:hypothetical protein
VASTYIVERSVSGGVEQYGPFTELDDAISKGCDLLKESPTAIVAIKDDKNVLIMDGGLLRARCEQLSKSQPAAD